ncbi:hypothetical protein PUN28_019357 [Cardiocondyla obscurior]|uniref:Uncharacterized protein n=1 Tax=Cardiocondyla obscurior TaxID=286306 RepID=A0AAW2EB58_9HYME
MHLRTRAFRAINGRRRLLLAYSETCRSSDVKRSTCIKAFSTNSRQVKKNERQLISLPLHTVCARIGPPRRGRFLTGAQHTREYPSQTGADAPFDREHPQTRRHFLLAFRRNTASRGDSTGFSAGY